LEDQIMSGASRQLGRAVELGWGVVGTGAIATDFVRALGRASRSRVLGVAGSTPEKARAFARQHRLPIAEPSLSELVLRPEIQAIYVATPHPLHEPHAIECIEAGKHVLCEKPLTVDAASAGRVIAAARRRGTFLMEAFMYRCHPLMQALIEKLRAGVIGEVRHVRADFGYRAPRDPHGRLFNPALAGGAILDVGCYPLSLVRLVAGVAAGGQLAEPLAVRGTAFIGPTGTDEVASASLRFASGITAEVACAVRHELGTRVVIFGERGRLILPNPWLPAGARQGRANTLVVHLDDERPQGIEVRARSASYALEADLVAASLPAQEAPWPAVTWDDSLGNMLALDAWRAATDSG
jgi:predicted dehydrogenase